MGLYFIKLGLMGPLAYYVFHDAFAYLQKGNTSSAIGLALLGLIPAIIALMPLPAIRG